MQKRVKIQNYFKICSQTHRLYCAESENYCAYLVRNYVEVSVHCTLKGTFPRIFVE